MTHQEKENGGKGEDILVSPMNNAFLRATMSVVCSQNESATVSSLGCSLLGTLRVLSVACRQCDIGTVLLLKIQSLLVVLQLRHAEVQSQCKEHKERLQKLQSTYYMLKTACEKRMSDLSRIDRALEESVNQRCPSC